jgi:cold shock CspA family protein
VVVAASAATVTVVALVATVIVVALVAAANVVASAVTVIVVASAPALRATLMMVPIPPEPTGPTTDAEGTVKWYKMDKGFGFVSQDNGGPDVFLHRSALRRVGLTPEMLQPGTKLKMKVAHTDKGLEAAWIAIL